MKRLALLIGLAFITMGGCYKHNFENELSIDAQAQSVVQEQDACHTISESLKDKRIEFTTKMQELRTIVKRSQYPSTRQQYMKPSSVYAPTCADAVHQ